MKKDHKKDLWDDVTVTGTQIERKQINPCAELVKKTQEHSCVLHRSLILKCGGSLKLIPKECRNILIASSQQHGYWWPGDGRSKGISTHHIDLVSQNILVSAPEEFITCGLNEIRVLVQHTYIYNPTETVITKFKLTSHKSSNKLQILNIRQATRIVAPAMVARQLDTFNTNIWKETDHIICP